MSVQYASTNFPAMDPRYQYLLSLRVSEAGIPKFVSSKENYLPVLAKISDLKKWKNIPIVDQGTEVKVGDQWIVTARILFSSFESVRRLSFVKSLKVTSPIFPLLKKTLNEIGLTSSTKIPESILAQGGKGVVVGIVDFGCDFNHKNFIKPSKKSRIHSIWNQGDEKPFPNGPYGYGRLFSRAEINKALSSSDPYIALDYYFGKFEHGTHVMDIAAGNGSTPGIAPRSKIMFVDLCTEKDKKLTDSVRVCEAVKYIFDRAEDHPCVVNLSLGQNGGSHDGTSLMEQYLDELVKEKPNRAIVIAAGNSYDDNTHYSGNVTNGNYFDINWNIIHAVESENELQIWYSGKDEFEIEIFYKNPTPIAKFSLGTNGKLVVNKDGKDVIVGFASHRKCDPNNSDNVFHLFHPSTCENHAGIWKLRLHGKNIHNGKFHAWIERGSDASFLDYDPSCTLGSISTGNKTIVVGSYDARISSTPMSYFSSSGPTRDGRLKPEISAPGHYVLAADSKSIDGLVDMSGTSMSAPAVTGVIARILGQAYRLKIHLNIDQIRDALIETCRKNPPHGEEWDPRYGFGRLNAEAILKVDEENPESEKDFHKELSKLKSLILQSSPMVQNLKEDKTLILGFQRDGNEIKLTGFYSNRKK